MPDNTHYLAPKPLPIDKGYPIIGHSFAILRDPISWGSAKFKKYGEAFGYRAFFMNIVAISSVEAHEIVWMDENKNFSTALGYKPMIGPVLDTSLLLMDFDEHRAHRQILNPAFKSKVLKEYVAGLSAAFSKKTQDWKSTGEFKFYPEIKQLTLDIATSVFVGLEKSEDRKKVNKALTDMLASLLCVVRLPIPGTTHFKAVQGRKYIEKLLKDKIPERRKAGGKDIFSLLCNQTDEEGRELTDDEILGHLMTFWIAGHDTLASSLATIVYHLGKNPQWQDKLRKEINDLQLDGQQPTLSDLNQLRLCDYAFREALRLLPPVLNTPRVALKDVTLRGYDIPKGTVVFNSIYETHHDPSLWQNPEEFDPMRFAPENTPKDRSRFAWVPYGGGPHKCIGLMFAQLQAKVFLVNLLSECDIVFPESYALELQFMPTPRPKDGLPTVFRPI